VKIILLSEVRQLLNSIKFNQLTVKDLLTAIIECDSIEMSLNETNEFTEIYSELKKIFEANIIEIYFKKINQEFSEKYLLEFENYWSSGNYKLALNKIEKYQQYTLLNKYYSKFQIGLELIHKFNIESIYLALANLTYYYLINDFKMLKDEYYKVVHKIKFGIYRKNKEKIDDHSFFLKLNEILTSNEYNLDSDLIQVQKSIGYYLGTLDKGNLIELVLLSDNQDEVKSISKSLCKENVEIKDVSSRKRVLEFKNIKINHIAQENKHFKKNKKMNLNSHIQIKSYENIRVIKDIIAQLMMVEDYESVLAIIIKNKTYEEELIFEKLEALNALGRKDIVGDVVVK
jgi:hypothetical protein